MGAGKTTVGRLLARRLGWEFLDTDEWIEREAGMTVAEIFESRGEPEFRRMERAVAERLAGLSGKVIATGGGFVVAAENLAAAERAGAVVLLEATPESVLDRVGARGDRPLLRGADPRARVAELLEKRRAAYDAVPLKVDTTGRPPEEVADMILEKISTSNERTD